MVGGRTLIRRDRVRESKKRSQEPQVLGFLLEIGQQLGRLFANRPQCVRDVSAGVLGGVLKRAGKIKLRSVLSAHASGYHHWDCGQVENDVNNDSGPDRAA